MAIRVALHHKTIYRYDRLVSLAPHIIRLRPAPHSRTPILSYSLSVQPAQHFLNWQQDPQGNYLARVEQARCLEILVDLVADLVVVNPFDFFLEPSAETYPFAYEPGLPGIWHRTWKPSRLARNSGVSGGCQSPARENCGVSGAAQPASATGSPVHHSYGAGDSVLRGDAGRYNRDRVGIAPGCWCRSCVISACSTLRVGISHSARARCLNGPILPMHAWAEVRLLDPTSGLFAGEGA